MMLFGRTWRGIFISAAGLMLIAAVARGAESHHPPPVYVGSHGLYVRAVQGSYCYSVGGKGICADAAYPLRVRSRLPVVPGARIAIDAGAHLKSAGASLLHVEGDDVKYLRLIDLTPRHGGRRWVARLPGELGQANVLSVDVFFPHHGGSSNTWAGLLVNPEDQGP